MPAAFRPPSVVGRAEGSGIQQPAPRDGRASGQVCGQFNAVRRGILESRRQGRAGPPAAGRRPPQDCAAGHHGRYPPLGHGARGGRGGGRGLPTQPGSHAAQRAVQRRAIRTAGGRRQADGVPPEQAIESQVAIHVGRRRGGGQPIPKRRNPGHIACGKRDIGAAVGRVRIEVRAAAINSGAARGSQRVAQRANRRVQRDPVRQPHGLTSPVRADRAQPRPGPAALRCLE